MTWLRTISACANDAHPSEAISAADHSNVLFMTSVSGYEMGRCGETQFGIALPAHDGADPEDA